MVAKISRRFRVWKYLCEIMKDDLQRVLVQVAMLLDFAFVCFLSAVMS